MGIAILEAGYPIRESKWRSLLGMRDGEISVLPLEAYHRSATYSMSGIYHKSLQMMLRKYRKDHEDVYTAMGDWGSAAPFSIARFLERIGFVRRLYIQANISSQH
jgi:hypothetical protein